MNSFRQATILYQMGLGDLINVSGAAVYLSRNYDRLNFPCRENYETSARSVFALHQKIHVFVLRYDDEYGIFPVIPEEMRENTLSMNWDMRSPILSRWENEYESFGVPYSARWDYCPIEAASKQVPQIEVPDEPYAFVHDDHSRDIKIREKYLPKDMRVVRPNPSIPNIVSYCSLITYATEGHYADSCFRHLAESIPTVGLLYYHEYAKHWSPILGEPEASSRKQWVTLK